MARKEKFYQVHMQAQYIYVLEAESLEDAEDQAFKKGREVALSKWPSCEFDKRVISVDPLGRPSQMTLVCTHCEEKFRLTSGGEYMNMLPYCHSCLWQSCWACDLKMDGEYIAQDFSRFPENYCSRCRSDLLEGIS